MSLRDDWNAIKKQAENSLGKSFFGEAGLGPKLDAAEKADDAYYDLPESVDRQVQRAARDRAADLSRQAKQAAAVYNKLLLMAAQSTGNTAAVRAAAQKANDDLTMKIVFKLDNMIRRLR